MVDDNIPNPRKHHTSNPYNYDSKRVDGVKSDDSKPFYHNDRPGRERSGSPGAGPGTPGGSPGGQDEAFSHARELYTSLKEGTSKHPGADTLSLLSYIGTTDPSRVTSGDYSDKAQLTPKLLSQYGKDVTAYTTQNFQHFVVDKSSSFPYAEYIRLQNAAKLTGLTLGQLTGTGLSDKQMDEKFGNPAAISQAKFSLQAIQQGTIISMAMYDNIKDLSKRTGLSFNALTGLSGEGAQKNLLLLAARNDAQVEMKRIHDGIEPALNYEALQSLSRETGFDLGQLANDGRSAKEVARDIEDIGLRSVLADVKKIAANPSDQAMDRLGLGVASLEAKIAYGVPMNVNDGTSAKDVADQITTGIINKSITNDPNFKPAEQGVQLQPDLKTKQGSNGQTR